VLTERFDIQLKLETIVTILTSTGRFIEGRRADRVAAVGRRRDAVASDGLRPSAGRNGTIQENERL
jgi:hypothetical protein